MKGKLSISNPRGSKGSWINIQLEDTKSGVEFLSVDISYEAFAKALFQHYQDCDFNLRYLDLIGKCREVKEEHVLVPNHKPAEREKAAAEAVALFETDGWQGRVQDAMNHHRRVESVTAGIVYRVSYIRFVDDD